MNICVFGASSNRIDRCYIEAGERLGREIAKAGHTVIFGGGAAGMMGAVARGVRAENGTLIGVSPSFFNVDGILYDDCTEMIYTETMRERKGLMEDRSDAFIITPGSIGTYDEFFETLCLRQLNCHNKPIILYNINGYFDPMLEMLRKTAEREFMKEDNLSLFYLTDSAEDALRYLAVYRAEDSLFDKF